MDENNVTYVAGKKPHQKTEVRRGALSVINGDINNRKRNINVLKASYKPLKQEKSATNFFLSATEKFKIFVDEPTEVNKENDDYNKENIVASTSSSSLISSPAKSDSSPEFVGLSPELQTDSLFSYAKKKKENLCSDSIWCTPYRQDICNYFLEIEKKFRPNPEYMEKQQDLNLQMRSILVDWIIEVGEEYKMHAETLHHAIAYVDRFLSNVAVLRGKLQLVGTASMFLAAKYEEIYPPEITDFVFITDNSYTKKQILRMEHLILKVLNFDISVPTAHTFLQLFCSMCKAHDNFIHFSQYICEISLLDGTPFLKFLPSQIAAASVALSNYMFGFEMWDEHMENATGIKFSDLHYVILCLYHQVKSLPSRPQHAIYEKYKSPKYGSVATMRCPDTLEYNKKK